MVSVLRLSKYRAYKMAFDKAGSAMTRNLERVSRLELKLRDASPAKHSKVMSKIIALFRKNLRLIYRRERIFFKTNQLDCWTLAEVGNKVEPTDIPVRRKVKKKEKRTTGRSQLKRDF